MAKFKKKKKLEDGAVVYEYSEKQVEHRHREKAKRIQNLSKGLTKLRKKVDKDISSSDDKTRLTALAVTLVDQTYERPGNEKSVKENEHFGVTTWQKQHVTVSGSTITFKYTGKSGVKHVKTVSDAKAAKAMKSLLEGKDKSDPVFECGEEGKKTCVRAGDVNTYLKDFDITAKDLRGYHANRLMQEELQRQREKGGKLHQDEKKREKALKKEFETALKLVADEVGHEAATLRTNYLVPALEDTFQRDGTVIKKLDTLKSARLARDVAMARTVTARFITKTELAKFADPDYIPDWVEDDDE